APRALRRRAGDRRLGRLLRAGARARRGAAAAGRLRDRARVAARDTGQHDPGDDPARDVQRDRAGRVARGMMRVALAALAVVALGVAWIQYVRFWRHGDAHPISYRDESSRLGGFETTHAVTRIYRHWTDDESAVLIASGPRSSTGYAIDVVGALHERGRILI